MQTVIRFFKTIFLVDLLKGLWVTLRYTPQPAFTFQYPAERRPTAPRFRGHAAPLVGMAVQTAVAVIAHTPLGGRELMRVVARDTTEASPAGPETTADGHLFDVPDRLVIRGQIRRPYEYGPKLLERQAWTIIERFPTQVNKAYVSLEMALLTDGFPQIGRQVAGIYDRVVEVSGHLLAAAAAGDM